MSTILIKDVIKCEKLYISKEILEATWKVSDEFNCLGGVYTNPFTNKLSYYSRSFWVSIWTRKAEYFDNLMGEQSSIIYSGLQFKHFTVYIL